MDYISNPFLEGPLTTTPSVIICFNIKVVFNIYLVNHYIIVIRCKLYI